MARPLVIAAVTGCLLVSATGCPAPEERSDDRTPTATAAPLPGRPTDASTDRPSYEGPPPDAPTSLGPLTTLRAAIDLSSAVPEPLARAESAVAAPDGGAYVVLGEPGPSSLPRLATVGRTADGFAVTGWVPLPDVIDAVGMHVLGDGTVAIAGGVFDTESPSPGFGFEVVDPREGVVRKTVLDPLRHRGNYTAGASALAPDGETLFLFSATETDHLFSTYDDLTERLFAVDATTGRVLAERDVRADVAAVSVEQAGQRLVRLVARPDGGTTLVFDAFPTVGDERTIPTLLTFDEHLKPVGGPVRVTSIEEDAETRDVAVGFDGTVFLLTVVSDDVWITAVPDGGGAGPILATLPSWFFASAMFVEAGQVWALLPAYEGARGVDLTTGELSDPLDLGCLPGRRVRAMVPDGDGAILLGECDPETQMLWLVGP